MNEEVVDATSFDGHFAVFSRDSFHLSIDVDAHHPGLHAKVLSLELMEVGRWTLGSVWAVDQLAQILRDGAFHVVAVGLAKKKTSSGWGLEELSGEKTSESVFFFNK